MTETTIRRVLWAGTVRNKPLAERLEACASGRFDWMTLFPSDLGRWRSEGVSLETMRSMLDDAGVRVLAIDPYGQWVPGFSFPDGYPPYIRAHFEYDEDDVMRMADGLGAEEINVIEPFREPFARQYERQALIDAFAGFATRAAARGFVTTLEFMPVSTIPDLATAWDIVETANLPMTGICFDTWHFVRSGSELALLETIPGDKITEVQISDAKAEVQGDLISDLLKHRLLPGEGELPLTELIATLKRTGAYRSVGPEIFSERFDALDATTAGRLAGASLDAWS